MFFELKHLKSGFLNNDALCALSQTIFSIPILTIGDDK